MLSRNTQCHRRATVSLAPLIFSSLFFGEVVMIIFLWFVCFFFCQAYILLYCLCFALVCSMYSALWHLPSIILRAWISQMFRENSARKKFSRSFNMFRMCILHAQTTSDLYEATTLHLTWVLVSDLGPFTCTYCRILHLFLLKKTSCYSCSSLIMKDMGMTCCVPVDQTGQGCLLIKTQKTSLTRSYNTFYFAEMFIDC